MEDYLVEIKKTAGEGDRLVFSGRLTIEHTDEIKSTLMRLVSTFSSPLILVTKEVTDFDLSFLQLFESFINLLKTKNINLTINWQMDEEQMKLLCGSGFSKYRDV
jgi:anti-anti-sigma regulatory factor